jgi:hypothetical protein
MKKRFVIKNSENNKYYTGNYNCFWSRNIDDAKQYPIIESLERDIEENTNGSNNLDSFENVKCVIVETIYVR